MIEAHDLSFSFNKSPVVDQVSLALSPGKITGLIGPNGSGKTTLLKLLTGVLTPHDGTVTIDGSSITALTPRQIAQRIAVVGQEEEIPAGTTVAECVALGRTPHIGLLSTLHEKDTALIIAALEQVGLLSSAKKSLRELSGGERKRAVIARALAQETPYIFLDEPTNHLDIRYQHEILHLVRSLESTVLVVLHDLTLAADYCDELILLDSGKVMAAGDPRSVLTPHNIRDIYGMDARWLASPAQEEKERLVIVPLGMSDD